MSENILKYISKHNLDICTGISNSGDIKLSPFQKSDVVTISTRLNYDQFGYNYINESKDYEKVKKFQFGIDFDDVLPTADFNTSFGFDSNCSYKSNETYLHAYRTIIKNEITVNVDSTKFPKFNDDAVNLLKSSTRKFHEIYGDYYISGLTKGGSLSIIGHLIQNNESNESNLDFKTKLDGNLSKVVKGNVVDEIASKKSAINSYKFSECLSKSISLCNETKKNNFHDLLDEIEELDKHIDDGGVLYYIVSKYDLCNEYTKICCEKSKWQLFLENFDNLNLEIQQANFDLYSKIKQNLGTNSQVDLKQDEIGVEIRLNLLIQENDYANMRKRIDECSKYIINNNIALAIQTLGGYGTVENIYEIIEKSFDVALSNFDKIIRFAVELKLETERGVVFKTLFTIMKDKRLTNKKEFIELFYYIHYYIKTYFDSFNDAAKEIYQDLSQQCIPTCLKIILWEPSCKILTTKSRKSYFLSNTDKQMGSENIRRIGFSHKSKYECWIFNTNDEGKTFTIKCKDNNGYLCLFDAAGISTKKNKKVVTQKCLDDTSYWCLELSDDCNGLRIFNAKSNDYLFIDHGLFSYKVYARGEADISDADIENTIFTVDKVVLNKIASANSVKVGNVVAF